MQWCQPKYKHKQQMCNIRTCSYPESAAGNKRNHYKVIAAYKEQNGICVFMEYSRVKLKGNEVVKLTLVFPENWLTEKWKGTVPQLNDNLILTIVFVFV